MTAPPFRLTVCGIGELAGHCEAGVSHVLSILDPDHPVPEAFGAFGEHAKLELRFHDAIEDVPGMLLPGADDVARLLAFGRGLEAGPANVGHLLVHCHAGISRSTGAMAVVLAQAMPDETGEAIMGHVLAIRDKAWPNLRIVEIGDAMLGRRGALVAAAHRVYARQLEIRPHLVEFMINCGRRREVEAAEAVRTAR